MGGFYNCGCYCVSPVFPRKNFKSDFIDHPIPGEEVAIFAVSFDLGNRDPRDTDLPESLLDFLQLVPSDDGDNDSVVHDILRKFHFLGMDQEYLLSLFQIRPIDEVQ